MTEISKNMATELADTWESMAATEQNCSPDRRATLRECADAIRMLANRTPERCPRAPGPFNYCPDCDGSFPCQMNSDDWPDPYVHALAAEHGEDPDYIGNGDPKDDVPL